MDNISEQLVRKKEDSSDLMKRVIIIAGGAAAVIGLFVLTVRVTPFAVIGIAAAVFAVYWLFISTFVEYEYIVSNEYLDIDKIIAKRRRVNMLSLDIREFTDFGCYEGQDYHGTTYSAVGGSEKQMYGLFSNGEHGEGRLVFSPDEKTLGNIHHYLKRDIVMKNRNN